MATRYKIMIAENGKSEEYELTVENCDEEVPDDSRNSDDNRNYKPAFPSSKLLLDSAIKEYDKEKERSDSLDNKAGIFIGAIVALITVCVQVVPLGSMLSAFEKASKREACILIASILLFVLGIIWIASSFYFFYKVIKLKNYQRVELENLTDPKLLTSKEDKTAEAMIRHYKEIVDYNQTVNDSKADDISGGLRRCLFGFVIVSIGTIMTSIIIGGIS